MKIHSKEKTIMIGFQNFIQAKKINSILTYNIRIKTIKLMIDKAKIQRKIIDATFGRKTRYNILHDEDFIVLTSLSTEIIANRKKEEDCNTINIGNTNYIPKQKSQVFLQLQTDSLPI